TTRCCRSATRYGDTRSPRACCARHMTGRRAPSGSDGAWSRRCRRIYPEQSAAPECYSAVASMATSVRTRILDSALECFTEVGYEQTTIARIRQRSDVTNGALFHHFPNKEAIADALYVEAIGSFQEGLWE